MKNDNMISKYTFTHYCFQNVHSIGSEIVFDNPCIGYIKKGCAKFLYNGKTFYAQEGDLIYIAYKTKYQSIWYGFPEVEWYALQFDFYSKTSYYNYRFQILNNYPTDFFEKMYNSYDSAPMVSIAYLYLILDDIYNKMIPSSLIKENSLIEPAIHYIECNYNKDIPILTLARLCHLSESTLFKNFKHILGVTPIAYKHNVMIQHAIELLANTDKSIEEISREVGFSSSNYFRKVFIKLMKKTPKELRKK